MTRLQPNRKLLRELDLVHRGRDLVVMIAAEGIYLKGRRERWSSAVFMPWAAAFDVAAKMRARKVLEERRAKRAARRAA